MPCANQALEIMERLLYDTLAMLARSESEHTEWSDWPSDPLVSRSPGRLARQADVEALGL